jgi:hypothetical protein
MSGLWTEVLATLAQGAAFVIGLILSLVVGMALAAHLDGPGGLLFATVVSGAGLLGSAALSQVLRDRMVERTPDFK